MLIREITAQDFTTAELIEALEKRGLQVLSTALLVEHTTAAREAQRAEFIAILERRLALYDELISEAIRDGFSAEGWRTARAALLVTFDEIRDRSNGGGK